MMRLHFTTKPSRARVQSRPTFLPTTAIAHKQTCELLRQLMPGPFRMSNTVSYKRMLVFCEVDLTFVQNSRQQWSRRFRFDAGFEIESSKRESGL